jgi:D-alanyl-lipoteichoic acid acyltransferase DltB (MBOAT superfamily)
MRLTEFWNRMHRTFGEVYADSWARDYVIAELGGRTVVQALAEGESAKNVWRAVCTVTDVDPKLR